MTTLRRFIARGLEYIVGGLFIVIALMATQTLGFFLKPFHQMGIWVVRLFI